MSEKNTTSKGSGFKDMSSMSKTKLKGHAKNVQGFYLENGWRETLSKFSLSPSQAAKLITEKVRAKRKVIEKESKRSGKKAEKKASVKGPTKKTKTGVAPKKSKMKAAPKKNGRKARKSPLPAQACRELLDYMIAYRGQNGGSMPLDTVIVDLGIWVAE